MRISLPAFNVFQNVQNRLYPLRLLQQEKCSEKYKNLIWSMNWILDMVQKNVRLVNDHVI